VTSYPDRAKEPRLPIGLKDAISKPSQGFCFLGVVVDLLESRDASECSSVRDDILHLNLVTSRSQAATRNRDLVYPLARFRLFSEQGGHSSLPV